MTNELLAGYANLSLYSAMAVFTVAMLSYAVYLAGLVPASSDAGTSGAEVPEREDALVAAHASAGVSGGAAEDASDAPETPVRHTPDVVDPGAGEASASGRTRQVGGVAWALTILGTTLLALGWVLRGVSVQRWPLGNMHEFAVAGSVFVMVAFVGWGLRRDLRWLGLFVVGPVLLTLGAAITVWYSPAAELMPSLKSVWLSIHVTVATLSAALFTIGFALGVLYLVQDRVERAGRTSFMNRLPGSRALERLAYGLHVVAFPLWTFTVIAGAIWARQAWGSYWNWDPKEVWSFVIWVVYAAYLHARATSGWKRQSATVIALVGFGCIIVNFVVVNVFFVGQHSYSGL